MSDQSEAEVGWMESVTFRFDARPTFELATVILFQLSFLSLYYVFLYPNYESMGFTFSSNIPKLIESVLLTAGVYVALPESDTSPSTVALRVLYVLMILPLFALYAVMDGPRPFIYAIAIGYVVTCSIVRLPIENYVQRASNRWVDPIPQSNFLVYAIVTGTTVAVYANIFYLNGLPPLMALDFSAVYEVRDAFVYGSTPMAYLLTWQAKVTNMFLIGVGWRRRRPSLIALGSVLQSVLYLYTGHKLFIFAPVLVLFVLYTRRNDGFLPSFLRVYLAASLVLFGTFVLTRDILPPFILIGRTYYLTAHIQFSYHEFFAAHQFVHLANSKVGFFVENPYSRAIPRIIGDQYYIQGTFANTGYTAAAFMHFGYVGIIAFSAVLGSLLKFVDWVDDYRVEGVTTVAILIPIYSLTQAGLTTVLGTHGLAFGIVLLLLYRRPETEK